MGKERIFGRARLMASSQMYNVQREGAKLLGAASDLVFHNFGG